MDEDHLDMALEYAILSVSRYSDDYAESHAARAAHRLSYVQ